MSGVFVTNESQKCWWRAMRGASMKPIPRRLGFSQPSDHGPITCLDTLFLLAWYWKNNNAVWRRIVAIAWPPLSTASSSRDDHYAIWNRWNNRHDKNVCRTIIIERTSNTMMDPQEEPAQQQRPSPHPQEPPLNTSSSSGNSTTRTLTTRRRCGSSATPILWPRHTQ
jgi:hypothetical protein